MGQNSSEGRWLTAVVSVTFLLTPFGVLVVQSLSQPVGCCLPFCSIRLFLLLSSLWVCLFIFSYLEPSPFSTSSPQLTSFPLVSDIISLCKRGPHPCPRQGRAPTSLHPHLYSPFLHTISRAIVRLPTYHDLCSCSLFTLFVYGLRWHLPPLAARQSCHKGGRFKQYQ